MIEVNTNQEFHKIKPTVSAEDVKRVKGLGCLWDKRTTDKFNVRIITVNGKMTADKLLVLSDLAEKYGDGQLAATTRLTIEIQGVPFANLEPLMAEVAEHGMETGGTGSKVRPVVSCKGTTCQYGLIDTFALSEKLHELFYEGYHNVVLPHKFKIAVGGCPNNCVKPDLNDLGIIGQRVVQYNFSRCKGCKICQVEQSCPIHAATLQSGSVQLDTDACNNCGRCKAKCPFGVTEQFTNGYQITVGGRWGKKVAYGRALRHLFTDEEEVIQAVENAILFFRNEGITGERFADTVARLGFDYAEEKILSKSVDKSKILQKQVTGGASC